MDHFRSPGTPGTGAMVDRKTSHVTSEVTLNSPAAPALTPTQTFEDGSNPPIGMHESVWI